MKMFGDPKRDFFFKNQAQNSAVDVQREKITPKVGKKLAPFFAPSLFYFCPMNPSPTKNCYYVMQYIID